VKAIDKGRSTTIAEGIWVELGVVLTHASSMVCQSDGSVSDGVNSREHESDGTEGEHGGRRHREAGNILGWDWGTRVGALADVDELLLL